MPLLRKVMIASILACVGIVQTVPFAHVQDAMAQSTKVADAARDFVNKVGNDSLDTLKSKTLSVEQKRVKLNGVFTDVVDVAYVAKFVLGRYWRTATPKQQQEYLKAYQPFLINNYVGRMTKFSGQTFTLTDSKPTEDGAVVGMILKTPDGSAPDVLVNYRLNKVGSGFKVIDIVVEGVSLLNTQRSEFSSIVSNKGLDYLISALQKKAASAAK